MKMIYVKNDQDIEYYINIDEIIYIAARGTGTEIRVAHENFNIYTNESLDDVLLRIRNAV